MKGFRTGLSHVPPWCESILGLKVEAVQGKQVSLEWTDPSPISHHFLFVYSCLCQFYVLVVSLDSGKKLDFWHLRKDSIFLKVRIFQDQVIKECRISISIYFQISAN